MDSDKEIKKWSDKEIKKLEELYPIVDNNTIANVLDRSVRSVRSMAFKLKLSKNNFYWNEKQEDYLVQHWKVLSAQELAEYLNKTKWSVINKYRQIKGLR